MALQMTKERLAAFSDGVIAIIITIMVLELRPPHENTFESLRPLIPVFISYFLSYIYLGIYWNNHHHLLHAIDHVDGAILWANMHLLFWLSLIPFVTAWVGETHFSAFPIALYGVVLLCAAISYFILTKALLRKHGKNSTLAKAMGKDIKGKISIVIYAVGIVFSSTSPFIAFTLYILVALIWIIPDQRIEKIK